MQLVRYPKGRRRRGRQTGKFMNSHNTFLGLHVMGLELFVEDPEARLPTVTTIKVPENIDWKAVTTYTMQK